MTAAGIGALGAAAIPMLLRRFFIKKDAAGAPVIPTWMTGTSWYAAQAIAGIAAGAIIGKLLKKPRWGAAVALGSVIVPAAAWIKEQPTFQGLAGDADDLGLMGAEYGQLTGIGDVDDADDLGIGDADDDSPSLIDFAA